jgi:proteasome lid subunit RPN8/RPN11
MWNQILAELAQRGEGCHEAGVFLLGVERGGRREVQDVVFYDDLDPEAYATGVCVLHGDAFAKLWATCRKKKMTVVADAHTHPGEAFQSSSDKANPMVARPGHIAIIIPNYARQPIRPRQIRIYEYCGQHEWIDRSPAKAPGFFYAGQGR